MISFARISNWDARTAQRINGINRLRPLGHLFKVVSRLGDGWFWYALMFLMPVVYGGAGLMLSLLLAANGLLATATYKWIKARTRRPRPSEVYASLTLTEAPLDRFSFPSGHTLHAVGFTVLICAFHPAAVWVLAPFTALVALSRMVLGLHYPSDVIAGGLIGATFSTLTLLMVQAAASAPPT